MMTYGFMYKTMMYKSLRYIKPYSVWTKNLKTRYRCKMSGFEIPFYKDDCYVWENRFPEFIKAHLCMG